VELASLLHRKPAELSGGQRQRVALARAIVRTPRLFLMDEPLSNLDAKLRVQMRTEVSRLQQKLGTTTVYVTHDQTEAMTLGDRVAVMRAGVLQQVDTPKNLYDHPRNIFVAGFNGSPAMNFMAGQVRDGHLELPFGEISLPEGIKAEDKVIVGIRPEDFEDAEFAPESHEGHEFEAPIEVVESMGSEIYAYFGYEGDDVQSDELRELAQDSGMEGTERSRQAVARLDPESSVREGAKARLWVNIAKIHVFDPSDGSNLALR